MSLTRRTTWDAKVLAVSCPTCEARPEAWCKTTSGRWASALHDKRWRAYWDTRR